MGSKQIVRQKLAILSPQILKHSTDLDKTAIRISNIQWNMIESIRDRLKRLEQLKAPSQIIENEKELLTKALGNIDASLFYHEASALLLNVKMEIESPASTVQVLADYLGNTSWIERQNVSLSRRDLALGDFAYSTVSINCIDEIMDRDADLKQYMESLLNNNNADNYIGGIYHKTEDKLRRCLRQQVNERGKSQVS